MHDEESKKVGQAIDEEKSAEAAKIAIVQLNLKFILALVFIPVIVLVVVLGICYVFITVMTGEMPEHGAITQIVKDLFAFIISLLDLLLGG